MGTCVSKCYPCSTAGASAGADDRSHSGSPTAVHPLPLPAAYASSPATPTASISTSLLSASSSISMASCTSTTISSSSSATTCYSLSSSRPPRPFSAEYLKARACRDMEVVVLDPNPNKKKRSASAAPRQLPRTPLSARSPLSVVRSPRKLTSSGSRHIPTTSKRVRPLPRAPPAGAAASRKRRPSCRLGATATRKSARATETSVGGEDDLNNPVISMDCFIFL